MKASGSSKSVPIIAKLNCSYGNFVDFDTRAPAIVSTACRKEQYVAISRAFFFVKNKTKQKQKNKSISSIPVCPVLRTGLGEGCQPPISFSLIFFRDELPSPPAVFSSCAHILYTQFDTRLVGIGCYGFLRDMTSEVAGGQSVLKENACFSPF